MSGFLEFDALSTTAPNRPNPQRLDLLSSWHLTPINPRLRSTHCFKSYSLPIPLLTAGRSAILSIHLSKCGKAFISSSVNAGLRFQPFTHGHVLMSATLYLPLPLPARYSLGSPVYLPLSWISSTPKTRRVSFLKRLMAYSIFSGAARMKWLTWPWYLVKTC